MYDELVSYVQEASDKATLYLKLTLDNSIKKDKINAAIDSAHIHLEACSILDTLIGFADDGDVEAIEILDTMLKKKARTLLALKNDMVQSIYLGDADYEDRYADLVATLSQELISCKEF